jgi:hypothetical protein
LEKVLEDKDGGTELKDRKSFAARAFNVSSHYDTAIFKYFNQEDSIKGFKHSIEENKTLRYGENPHQEGVFFGDLEELFDQLNGKELSYNNLVDVDAAVSLMEEFENDKAMRRLRLAPMEKRIEAAVALNLPWCVEELYMLGAPCDLANYQGWQPLHLAAARNFPECVRVLLNMRMDIKVNAITTKGYTPLYLAHSCQAPECAKMIHDAGGLPTAAPPMQGYRSILDMNVNIPSAVPFANRAADDRARNLNKPAYFGAY